MKSATVRQPDSDRFRLWEVAGTSHADAHLLGSAASGVDCGVAINDGPMHLVAKAAFHSLEAWARGGTPPTSAPLLDVDTAALAIQRDADGIARAGIRTPPVDVPVDVLSGEPAPKASLFCTLLGSTTPLPDARIAELYANRADYEAKYQADADQTITSGFVLEADRDALSGFAQPLRVAP